MRLKFFCQAMLIAGVLAACGGNNSSTDNTAETSNAVSVESTAAGNVVQTGVVRKVSGSKSSTESTSKAVSETTVTTTTTVEETTTAVEILENTSEMTEERV